MDTAFQMIGYRKSAVMLLVANPASGKFNEVATPLTMITSMHLASSEEELVVAFSSSSSSLPTASKLQYPISSPVCLSYTKSYLILISSKKIHV